MNRVTCIGELLIDFICSDINEDLSNGVNFVKKPGGAPANVAAAIARLGGKASFVGKVGADPFGRFLKAELAGFGVDTSGLRFSEKLPTTLAFVSLMENGERDFVFHRGADGDLTGADIDITGINASRILHMGSATALLSGETRISYMNAIDLASKAGVFVSFDPNYRTDLWSGRQERFRELASYCMKRADFIKMSDEELGLLGGTTDPEAGIRALDLKEKAVVAVTLGSRGTFLYCDGSGEVVETVKVRSVDSTGAGDAFTGGVLFKLAAQKNIFSAADDSVFLREAVSFGNRVGALVCTRLGAMSALPTLAEVEALRQ